MCGKKNYRLTTQYLAASAAAAAAEAAAAVASDTARLKSIVESGLRYLLLFSSSFRLKKINTRTHTHTESVIIMMMTMMSLSCNSPFLQRLLLFFNCRYLCRQLLPPPSGERKKKKKSVFSQQSFSLSLSLTRVRAHTQALTLTQ